MLTYDELLKKRRSIRKFKAESVSQTLVNELLIDACKAPSASNHQPWNFIVIHDQNLIKRLSDESKKNLLKMIEANPKSPYRPYKRMLSDPNFNVFYNAPTLILIVGKNNYSYFQIDCTLCACYLMFAAVGRNLGTCWIGLGERIEDEKIKKEIGLPDGFEIVAPIVIGHPAQIPEFSHRKPPVVLKTVAGQ